MNFEAYFLGSGIARLSVKYAYLHLPYRNFGKGGNFFVEPGDIHDYLIDSFFNALIDIHVWIYLFFKNIYIFIYMYIAKLEGLNIPVPCHHSS